LDKQLNKKIFVKFSGEREIIGILKGFDSMVNLVLDDCVEYIRGYFLSLIIDFNDPSIRKVVKVNDKDVEVTRKLGIVVCRGTSVSYITPYEGFEEIENPYE
jgi:U6 snRNA-associated Sm-like protein LSm7